MQERKKTWLSVTMRNSNFASANLRLTEIETKSQKSKSIIFCWLNKHKSKQILDLHKQTAIIFSIRERLLNQRNVFKYPKILKNLTHIKQQKSFSKGNHQIYNVPKVMGWQTIIFSGLPIPKFHSHSEGLAEQRKTKACLSLFR